MDPTPSATACSDTSHARRARRRVLAGAVAMLALAAVLASCSSGDGVSTTQTSAQATTTSATAPVTTQPPSTLAPTSTTLGSTTTAPSAGAPGDSAGSWVEVPVPGAPADAHAVSVSDEALLIAAREGSGATLWAYLFDRDELIRLPVTGTDVFQPDIDGTLAVWWEGTFDDGSSMYTEQHIYAYPIPDGPKIEIAKGRQGVSYPQVAGSWISWTEGSPSTDLPDEYWRMPILGVKVDSQGAPQGAPVELMPSAIAAVAGDSFFDYSLSGTHLAWEQGRAAGDLALGTHVMDLDGLQPFSLGREAWRPSIDGGTLVYYENGLKARDLETGQVREIDAQGDYASAASSFAAYFRATDGGGYELVARGLTGGYEQVLGSAAEPPWLSPDIAASAHHVAFIARGAVKLFEWQGR